MGEEKKVDNPTRTFFPQMLQATKLLILDYDVTRYHSFDLFRFLLLDHDNFMHCNPSFIPMIKEEDPYKQIKLYMKNATSLNPYGNFVGLYEDMKIVDMENSINQIITNELVHFTYTDLYHNFGVIFERHDVKGYVLRYKNDPHTTMWDDRVKVYKTDHMFDLAMAVAIIKKHRINTIIISSIDAAILLCGMLEKEEYTNSITFIIGNYLYNYLTDDNQPFSIMKHMDYMRWYEQHRKYEFGLFDPFSFKLETEE